MRFLYFVAAGSMALLSGCATSPVSTALLGMNNVEIGAGPNGYQYVNNVTYTFNSIPVGGESLPMCVVENVQNNSVTLSDSADSKYLPYIGYVSTETAREVGGGQVIAYMSEDKMSVMANGVTSYQTDSFIPINRVVRFSVSVKALDNSLSAVFSNIDHAQTDTGVASNSGYSKLGAWAGASPELAIGALKNIADNIAECIKRQ